MSVASAPAQRASSVADPECTPGSALYGEILQFLYQEAELLDECRFREWLGLFAEDIRYTMPVRTTQFRARGPGFQDVAFIEDNFNSLTTRVERLLTDTAWAETPPSRTRHFISNVLVRLAEKPGEFVVRSSFMVTRSRGGQGYQMFTGLREDTLRRVASGALCIAYRNILVDQTVITGTNLSILF